MIDRADLIADLLGQPYEACGRHCWWLSSLIEREVFDRDLPGAPEKLPRGAARDRLLRQHPARAEWRQHEHPADGDLVLMGTAPGRDTHCGVYLADHCKVIHTDHGHGVVLESVVELRARGWYPSFHRPI